MRRMTLKQIADWALNRIPPPVLAEPGPATQVPQSEYHGYLDMIRNRFVAINPHTALGDCNYFMGDEGLPLDLRNQIMGALSHLHGVPVSFVPGAVGAVLLPPNYKSAALAKAKAAPKKVRIRAKKDTNV